MSQSREARIRFANDEVLGRGNLDVLPDIFARDYVVHAGEKLGRGHAFIRRFVGLLRAAIPDLRVVAVEILVQSGDTIAWQRTLRGTHENDMMGIPPSMKTVTWTEMLVSRFDGDTIAEEWAVSELAGQLVLTRPDA